MWVSYNLAHTLNTQFIVTPGTKSHAAQWESVSSSCTAATLLNFADYFHVKHTVLLSKKACPFSLGWYLAFSWWAWSTSVVFLLNLNLPSFPTFVISTLWEPKCYAHLDSNILQILYINHVKSAYQDSIQATVEHETAMTGWGGSVTIQVMYLNLRNSPYRGRMCPPGSETR